MPHVTFSEAMSAAMAANNQFVREPVVRVIDQDDQAAVYRLAFDQVCNKDDWKAPFACWVPWTMANLYMQAIEFMTGVEPTCGGRVVLVSGHEVTRLDCIGYRNGPCGG